MVMFDVLALVSMCVLCVRRAGEQIGMQRCPYLQEMKERLVGAGGDADAAAAAAASDLLAAMDKDLLQVHADPAVGTVVKVRGLAALHCNFLR